MRRWHLGRKNEYRFTIRILTVLATVLAFAPLSVSAADPSSTVERGKKLSVELCQACHFFEGSNQAGTVGPPFVAMKPRFPERQKLQNIIYDPQVASKPHSMMPPFGRNALLSDNEIRLIMDYLYTL